MGSCVSQSKKNSQSKGETITKVSTYQEINMNSNDKPLQPQHKGTLNSFNLLSQQSNQGSNQVIESCGNIGNTIFHSCDGSLFQHNFMQSKTDAIQVTQSIQEISNYSDKQRNKKVQEYNQIRLSRKNNANKYTVENLRRIF